MFLLFLTLNRKSLLQSEIEYCDSKSFITLSSSFNYLSIDSWVRTMTRFSIIFVSMLLFNLSYIYYFFCIVYITLLCIFHWFSNCDSKNLKFTSSCLEIMKIYFVQSTNKIISLLLGFWFLSRIDSYSTRVWFLLPQTKGTDIGTSEYMSKSMDKE